MEVANFSTSTQTKLQLFKGKKFWLKQLLTKMTY